MDNDEFRVELENRVAFDTKAPSVHLFPGGKITTTRTVTFPNLVSTILYFHRGDTGGPYACESWSALLLQEHSPDLPNFSPTFVTNLDEKLIITRNLPEESLGSVPSGTNYIDVRARLRRTIVPPKFLDQDPPYTFHPENEWVNLPGGSCICEYFAPLVRSFDVVLSGTSVSLRRFQSTHDGGSSSNSMSGNTNNGNFTQTGSQWGNYTRAPVGRAAFAVLLDAKGFDSTTNKRPPWGDTSNGSCAVRQGNPVNYTSQYEVDFEITPGRYKPSV